MVPAVKVGDSAYLSYFTGSDLTSKNAISQLVPTHKATVVQILQHESAILFQLQPRASAKYPEYPDTFTAQHCDRYESPDGR